MWCATGVNLSGGVTKDGGAVVGASVFYNNNNNNLAKQDIVDIEINTDVDESMEMKKLDEELKVYYFFTSKVYVFIVGKCYYFRKIVDQM